ncbi:MAG TPA: hypothetical protein VK941_11690 [Gillisia sp.]|nr:hypothetical protein [Gillisia sp.]
MKKSLFITAICAIVFTSCSPKMTGTWNVDRYAVDNQEGRSMNTTNAGTIKIDKNGSGEKDINYNMFQTEFSDTQTFRWNMPSEDVITITSPNSSRNSDLDKTWIIVSQKKNNQIWKSTDGKNTIQTLELSKN